MGADVLVTQGISNHDIYYVEPNEFGLHTLMVIRTLHDWPSQMNEELLISNNKLTSDSELIWWR